jgi:hypothetical protein
MSLIIGISLWVAGVILGGGVATFFAGKAINRAIDEAFTAGDKYGYFRGLRRRAGVEE